MVTILRLSLCFDRICGIKKSCGLHFMKNVYIVNTDDLEQSARTFRANFPLCSAL